MVANSHIMRVISGGSYLPGGKYGSTISQRIISGRSGRTYKTRLQRNPDIAAIAENLVIPRGLRVLPGGWMCGYFRAPRSRLITFPNKVDRLRLSPGKLYLPLPR